MRSEIIDFRGRVEMYRRAHDSCTETMFGTLVEELLA